MTFGDRNREIFMDNMKTAGGRAELAGTGVRLGALDSPTP